MRERAARLSETFTRNKAGYLHHLLFFSCFKAQYHYNATEPYCMPHHATLQCQYLYFCTSKASKLTPLKPKQAHRIAQIARRRSEAACGLVSAMTCFSSVLNRCLPEGAGDRCETWRGARRGGEICRALRVAVAPPMVWRRYVWSSTCSSLAREMVEFTEAVKSIVSARRELSMRQHTSACVSLR